MNRSRSITVKLTGIGEFGDVIGEYDGKRVNVFGGIPGETVTVRVIRRNDDRHRCRRRDVIEPSPSADAAVCPISANAPAANGSTSITATNWILNKNWLNEP